jgi:hypothetical protein
MEGVEVSAVRFCRAAHIVYTSVDNLPLTAY